MELDANLCQNTYDTTNCIPIQAIDCVEPTSDLLQDCSHVCTTGIASADEQDIDGLLELIPECYCTPVVKKKLSQPELMPKQDFLITQDCHKMHKMS